jgi:putative sterol carrier protein
MEQASSTREFFETLATRIDPAKLAGEAASYRFVIEGAGSWRVGVADGQVAVTEAEDGGDCVIRMKDETFGKLLSGRQNPVTGFMTGKIKIDGDMGLAMKLKDLFF